MNPLVQVTNVYQTEEEFGKPHSSALLALVPRGCVASSPSPLGSQAMAS